jgi:hypothetical protein
MIKYIDNKLYFLSNWQFQFYLLFFSEGKAILISSLKATATANKVKKSALIKVFANITRSGLKFA